MLFAWGSRQIAAATKIKSREPEEASGQGESNTADEYMRGSMHNVLILFGWVLRFIAVAAIVGLGYLFLFHHRP